MINQIKIELNAKLAYFPLFNGSLQSRRVFLGGFLRYLSKSCIPNILLT
ncbi:hypothetical protein MPQ_0459 [Methylovorus sp. MP688]|nr:hypothetical protein MPQ_0459 [Methylovorus sp. MP688]